MIIYGTKLETPITFSQLFYSLVILLLILYFSRKIKKREHLIALLLFGLFFIVVILWQWSPDLRNYFIQMPEKPNFTYFPYSDAQNFDYGGQFLRFGYGIENFEDTTYPFTMFLTNIYHFFAKQDFCTYLSNSNNLNDTTPNWYIFYQ